MGTGAKIAAGLALMIAAGAALLWRSAGDPVRATDELKAAPEAKAALATDEERLAYVAKFVVVHDLVVDPDTKPGEDGSVQNVPGLLRVHGQVENTGDKPVTPVNLVLHPQDDTGGVLGTYLEDITGSRELTPGEKRPFKFHIPDKKAFGGRFLHNLR